MVFSVVIRYTKCVQHHKVSIYNFTEFILRKISNTHVPNQTSRSISLIESCNECLTCSINGLT